MNAQTPINLTFPLEILLFAMLVWLMMKFIWPPLIDALNIRQKRIEEGLAASELARTSLEAAQIQAQEAVNIARGNAAEIINRANEQATQIRLEAKHHASKTIQKKLIETQAAIALEKVKAESDLDQSVADLAECCANKLLSGTKDPSDS